MLSINISELVLTVANFFLLYFVLDRLLFRPLITFMEKRQARIDACMEKEKAARLSVEEDLERKTAREALLLQETQQRVEKVRAENRLRREQLLARLRLEEEEKRKALEADMEHFEDEERAELAVKDNELAGLLAARLLEESI